MRRHAPAIAVAMMLITSSAGNGRAEPGRPGFQNGSGPPGPDANEVMVSGSVEHIYAPRLFTIARDYGAERELLVFAPTAVLMPRSGSRLVARGVFRQYEDVGFESTPGYEQFNELTGGKFASRPVLVARSFDTFTGAQRPRGAGVPPATTSQSRQDEPSAARGSDTAIAVRPGALADLIESLAGRAVRVRSARVVGVLDPRVFLIESQTRLLPLVDRNRILVFIEAGALRVDPAVLVASTVTVSGVARTLLGMQVSRDVPWPPALTPEVVERLEIRAAVLARSVRTNEGVDLLVRLSPAPPPADR